MVKRKKFVNYYLYI